MELLVRSGKGTYVCILLSEVPELQCFISRITRCSLITDACLGNNCAKEELPEKTQPPPTQYCTNKKYVKNKKLSSALATGQGFAGMLNSPTACGRVQGFGAEPGAGVRSSSGAVELQVFAWSWSRAGAQLRSPAGDTFLPPQTPTQNSTVLELGAGLLSIFSTG
ncbi:unnamed protein product [Lepidochelys olivacea]